MKCKISLREWQQGSCFALCIPPPLLSVSLLLSLSLSSAHSPSLFLSDSLHLLSSLYRDHFFSFSVTLIFSNFLSSPSPLPLGDHPVALPRHNLPSGRTRTHKMTIFLSHLAELMKLYLRGDGLVTSAKAQHSETAHLALRGSTVDTCRFPSHHATAHLTAQPWEVKPAD